ncbi:MAG: hypothetical protein MHMPM18_004639 [Marteilia pararefringens]
MKANISRIEAESNAKLSTRDEKVRELQAELEKLDAFLKEKSFMIEEITKLKKIIEDKNYEVDNVLHEKDKAIIEVRKV